MAWRDMRLFFGHSSPAWQIGDASDGHSFIHKQAIIRQN